jgi:hypothetical protein
VSISYRNIYKIDLKPYTLPGVYKTMTKPTFGGFTLEAIEGIARRKEARQYVTNEMLAGLTSYIRTLERQKGTRAELSDSFVEITINGQKREVRGSKMSYNDVVHLAYSVEPSTLVTVTYHGAAGGTNGSLLPGDSVSVQEGTVFNATLTGNA